MLKNVFAQYHANKDTFIIRRWTYFDLNNTSGIYPASIGKDKLSSKICRSYIMITTPEMLDEHNMDDLGRDYFHLPPFTDEHLS